MNREKAKRLQKMFLYFRWVCMALLLLVLFFYAYNVNAQGRERFFFPKNEKAYDITH